VVDTGYGIVDIDALYDQLDLIATTELPRAHCFRCEIGHKSKFVLCGSVVRCYAWLSVVVRCCREPL
jgi:hypothetical protein